MSARVLIRPTWRGRATLLADAFFGISFVLGDFIVLGGSFLAAVGRLRLAHLSGTPPVLAAWMQDATGSHLIAFIVSVPFVLFALWGQGLYSKRQPFWEELALYVKWLALGALLEIGVLLLLTEAPIDVRAISLTWSFALLAGPVLRALLRKAFSLTQSWRRPILIVGTGKNARATFHALRQDGSLGYRVEAFVSASNAPGAAAAEAVEMGVPMISLSEALLGLSEQHSSAQLILALDSLEGQEALFANLAALRPNLLVAPPLRGFPVHGVEVLPLFGGDIILMGLRNNLKSWPACAVKRAVDVVLSTVLVALVLLPVYVVVAVLIRLQDKGPVFYRHKRIGCGGREFQALKFRTMVHDAESQLQTWAKERPEVWQQFLKEGFKLRDDPRILKFGHFLRASSIDELPQLINVLRGEMSLVGPRPIVASEVSLYGPEFELYKQVRPGITGLWQVSGRSGTTYPERSRLDAWYVRNWSLWYDLAILIRTVVVVVGRAGAY